MTLKTRLKALEGVGEQLQKMRSFIELRGGEEAKKMNVWNKVLMILTGLLCAAYAVFAANVYQNNKDWRQKNDGLEEQIAKQLEDNVKLYNGTCAPPGGVCSRRESRTRSRPCMRTGRFQN